MRSLTDLNNFGATSIEVTDLRPATVIFDRAFPQLPNDQILTIASTTVNPEPGIEIEEIINYQTANVRYRVRIVPGTVNPLTGSTISWASLPTGVTLSTVGNTYTLSGLTSVSDWNAVKNFTWTLPANYATKPLWFLEVEVIYYDQELDEEVTKEWIIYDDRFFYVSEMFMTTSASATGRRLLTSAVAMSSAFTCREAFIELQGVFRVRASAVDAVIKSNATLFADPGFKIQATANVTATSTASATGTVIQPFTATANTGYKQQDGSNIYSSFTSNHPGTELQDFNSPGGLNTYRIILTASDPNAGIIDLVTATTYNKLVPGFDKGTYTYNLDTGNYILNSVLDAGAGAGIKFFPMPGYTSPVTVNVSVYWTPSYSLIWDENITLPYTGISTATPVTRTRFNGTLVPNGAVVDPYVTEGLYGTLNWSVTGTSTKSGSVNLYNYMYMVGNKIVLPRFYLQPNTTTKRIEVQIETSTGVSVLDSIPYNTTATATITTTSRMVYV